MRGGSARRRRGSARGPRGTRGPRGRPRRIRGRAVRRIGFDRKALGKRVFADDAALRTLEAIVHPRVRARLEEKLEGIRREDRGRLVVLDVPLLLESPFASRCREFVFVEASPATREARVRATRAWPPGETARREAKQESLDRKRSQARFVVRNDGAKDVTFRQVIDVVNALLQEQERAS